MNDSQKKNRPEVRRSTVTTYDSITSELESGDLHIEQYLFPKTPFLLCLLTEYIQDSMIFSNLNQIQRQTLLQAMGVRNYDEGEFLFKTGETADTFYIVKSGKFKACDTNSGNIREYYKGDMINELAMIYPYKHKFNVKAITYGSVWCINRQIFRRIKLTLLARERKLCETYLAKIPIFKQLHTDDFITLADCLERRSIKKGEFVYKQQSIPDGLYIVEQGIVNVCVEDDVGNQVILYKIKKGEYFGERSMITCCLRNTSAIAENDVDVAFLSVSAFERLHGFCKDIAVEEDVNRIFGSKVNILHLREL